MRIVFIKFELRKVINEGSYDFLLIQINKNYERQKTVETPFLKIR